MEGGFRAQDAERSSSRNRYRRCLNEFFVQGRPELKNLGPLRPVSPTGVRGGERREHFGLSPLIPRGAHAGEEGAEFGVVAQGDEL
jgi:hypothetical protein